MFEIKTTDQFDAWLKSLRDGLTRRRVVARLRKASMGLLGDVKPVGEGISEMREHFGSGWRLYFVQHGDTLIVMLAGGDKASQTTDIALAIRLARQLKEEL